MKFEHSTWNRNSPLPLSPIVLIWRGNYYLSTSFLCATREGIVGCSMKPVTLLCRKFILDMSPYVFSSNNTFYHDLVSVCVKQFEDGRKNSEGCSSEHE
jgi:hypothetical protein